MMLSLPHPLSSSSVSFFFILIILFFPPPPPCLSSVLSPSSSSCVLPAPLRGLFSRQLPGSPPPSGPDSLADVPAFEQFRIGKHTARPWGKCVRQIGQHSFIFRSSSPPLPLCFRCITLLPLATNVLQSLHQDESICHKSVRQTERSCFDAAKVSPTDGTLLFRHNSIEETSRDDEGCQMLEGKFRVEYQLKLTMEEEEGSGGKFECRRDSGSEMSSCQPGSDLSFRFRNCSFPDFEQTLRCWGSWDVRKGQRRKTTDDRVGGKRARHVAMFNARTMEFRCGLLLPSAHPPLSSPTPLLKLFLSVDSSCARLAPDGHNALEEFTLQQDPGPLPSEAFPADHSALPPIPCQMPAWLHGHFANGLRIGPAGIEQQRGGARGGNVLVRCVRHQPEEHPERFLVHSGTKCALPIGFHCLWFRARSDVLIELRTTGLQSRFDPELCNIPVSQFSPWTTMASLDRPNNTVPCPFRGHFSTPKEFWTSGECHSVSFGCPQNAEGSKKSLIRLVTSQCQTGKAIDVDELVCLASWREGATLFLVASPLASNDPSGAICFAIRHSPDDHRLIRMTPLGPNCVRDVGEDEGEGRGTTMVLRRKGEECGEEEKHPDEDEEVEGKGMMMKGGGRRGWRDEEAEEKGMMMKGGGPFVLFDDVLMGADTLTSFLGGHLPKPNLSSPPSRQLIIPFFVLLIVFLAAFPPYFFSSVGQ